MVDRKKKWEVNDEEQYVGNFFGWEVSKIGAIVMIVLGAIIAYRWFSLPPEKRTFAPPPVEEVIDSTATKE